MRDPYEVLGVDRKASAGDIKSAYRRVCEAVSPTPTRTIPRRRRRFAELNAVHELLEDDDKRKAFDRGEIDAEGKPRFRGFEGFGGGARPGGAPGGGFGPEANFENFNFGLEGLPGRRGAGAAPAASPVSRTSSRKHSDAVRAAAPDRRSRRRISASAPTCKPKCRCRCRTPPEVPRSACTCRTARMSTSKFPPASPTVSTSGSRARAWRGRRSRRLAHHRLDRAAPGLHARRR